MRPILFNTKMVHTIMEGQKTCTRRVIKPQPPKRATIMQELSKESVWAGDWCNDADSSLRRPPYMSGDVLYVREAWQQNYDGTFSYRAGHKFEREKGWKPSIHMPKEAARIFLRVTNVHVEKLQDINDSSALKEGAADREDFIQIWNSTVRPVDYSQYSWDANPWVWVIDFERSRDF